MSQKRRLTANKGNCGCGCGGSDHADETGVIGHSIEANLSAFTARREIYEGRNYLVVPIVLLRHTVANQALIEADELFPESWNGVPVTVHHPADQAGDFMSANTPDALSSWHVGRIFNSKMDGDKLRGEAWIDIERAEKVSEGLVAQLESGEPMDVSTGYFSKHEKTSGTHNGKKYRVKHRDLKPDHLALLPNQEGACSWADGCGVRVNTKGDLRMKVETAISVLTKALGLSKLEVHMDKDKKPLIEKITANSSMKSVDLEKMDVASLTVIANGLPVANAETEEEKKKREAAEAAAKKPDANAGLTEDRVAAIVANALEAHSNKQNEGKRAGLVSAVTANGAISKAVAEKMTIEALEEVAAALVPADYSGRGAALSTFNAAETEDDLPLPYGTNEHFAAMKKTADTKGAH